MLIAHTHAICFVFIARICYLTALTAGTIVFDSYQDSDLKITRRFNDLNVLTGNKENVFIYVNEENV